MVSGIRPVDSQTSDVIFLPAKITTLDESTAQAETVAVIVGGRVVFTRD